MLTTFFLTAIAAITGNQQLMAKIILIIQLALIEQAELVDEIHFQTTTNAFVELYHSVNDRGIVAKAIDGHRKPLHLS